MKWFLGGLALAPLMLMACAPKSSVPDGAFLLDETVTLTPDPQGASARRTLRIDGPSLIVARVDEQLQDVRLTVAVRGGEAARQQTVENNLAGAGSEIAVLAHSFYTQ